ncbi:nitrous oxide reductase family maturation protein NosD [Cohaesibacter celericrescens]|uniref:Nitrous oxide reductase family maturation protein NosD n=1 Tax=Cohaesibacter celericrescens TaxID=2067669 RepID=A0A2N5XUD7_9HYPH|nr:nitrous oxide reductase family maturation protein NosD [Cohaesibacter celericrescens]PLW78132.1 nitrous oxide reductase family maturation protein NosD [Cohaesibacter celericrescens]
MLLRLIFILLMLAPTTMVGAVEIVVSEQSGALTQALNNAKAGDIIRLQPGSYKGPIVINKAIILDGGGKAAIVGNEIGSVISVTVPNVTVRGLTITGSGSKGNGRDAGVFLGKKAENAVVSDNKILGNLVGVDVRGSKNALVTRNIIQGRQDHRMNDRGNGVYMWNAPGAKVIKNDFRWGRDGIFVNTSKNNEFSNNRFRDLRFAVHYMYANNSVVSGNISLGNHLGYAIMYSDDVRIEGNYSKGDRNHGIMMNYTNRTLVLNNHIEQVGDKCVFIYNAHRNSFKGNLFSGCGIGIHFTAGSERNDFISNAFVGNRTQVKYVGTRWIDWSVDGHGNYWSDHAAYDLDGNGIADTAYRPNDIMDHVLWTQPAAKFLLGSPAIQLIRWSQSAFPALLPGGVIDQAPMMHPLLPQPPSWEEF